MSSQPAPVSEFFSSVQGEGAHVGLRQAFLRFQGCNLACAYCDTGNQAEDFCRLELTPGRRDFILAPSPVSLERVAAILDGWLRGWPGVHHSLSITGGEPLIHEQILREWLPVLKGFLPVYLETNGVLHGELARLIGHLDYISMDMKLPSATCCEPLWEEHRQFLQIAAQSSVYVKTVVNDLAEEWEIGKVCDIITSIDSSIPLIFQPETRADGIPTINHFKLLELQEFAAGRLKEVRIIPQTHKFLGML